MVLLMIYRPSGLIGRLEHQGHVVEMSTTGDTPVLRLKGVNKRFGGLVAANNVDLDLPPASSPRWSGRTAPARPRCST